MDEFPEDYECEGQIDIWEWMEEKEKQSMTREELSCMIEEYLDDHTIGEFLDLVACRIADKEEELRKMAESEET